MSDPVTKRITPAAALEALDSSDWKCSILVIGHGRCAQAVPSSPDDHRTPLHHAVPRSLGGGHEASNIIPLCPRHHDLVHERGKPLLQDEQGRRYWQLHFNGGLRKHFIWDDFREDMTVHAAELDARFQADYRRESFARIEMARTLAEMERFALFSLTNGEPDDVDEYLAGHGINSPSTRRSLLAAGEFLLDNPDEYERIKAYNEKAAAGEEFTWSMLKNGVGTLKRLGDGNRIGAAVTDMMVQRGQGVPGEAIIESLREDAGVPAKNTYTVTAIVSATETTLSLDVTAASPKAAWREFERITGASGRLSGILKVEHKRTRKS